MNILVRNLPRTVSERELVQMFSQYGPVESYNLVFDALTGESKGFGYIEMEKDSDAKRAIKGLNGSEVQNKKIRVKITKAIKPKRK